MTLPELIEVLQAAALGKTIEARAKGSEQWSEVTLANVGDLTARLAVGDILRVKPEPREWWAAIYGQSGLDGGLWKTKEEAEEYSEACEIIRVREVLE